MHVRRVVGPVVTVLLAFLLSGVAILAIGKSPWRVYRAIFDGTGLNWFFHPGSHSIRLPFTATHVWFPWDTASTAALNLQQTLLTTTPIILTALAVAVAFRSGMFNIGGQGQYFVGSFAAVWVGSSFAHLASGLHVVLAIVAAVLAGAAWAGIAGLLKGLVGAHEVITTIMLNWVAIWVGTYAFGFGGPLQNSSQPDLSLSNTVVPGARLPVFWGSKLLQGLTVGFLIAVAMLVVYWLLMSRTTLGFGMRVVGFNPEAARYGGISVTRNYVLAMAIGGAFAGLAGACDILGWAFQLDPTSLAGNNLPFIGLAAALLGRNTAVGIGAASLLFGGLLTGTADRQLDPSVFRPDLAGDLTTIIQGLVILFVGLNLTGAVGWWRRRRRVA